MRGVLPITMLAAFVAAIPLTAAAQETPTEKTAAADVIRRMGDLERSLTVSQLVTRLTSARDPRRDAVIARAKELMDKELIAMADDITRHPETGWKEERSVKILTDYLKAHDFAVEMGVAGLKTAFIARYSKGTPGPNLGVILEYDALRGTSRDFHGDQHSAQGPVGMAAAVAVAEFLTASKTPGTVTVYGTPAEELASPAAKTVMYNAGVFKGADVLIRSHSSTATQAPGPGFGSCCMNINVIHYVFSGAPAHQLQAWDGRDALKGLIELFNNIDGIRMTVRPETKIQGIITEGGKAPNVVPDRTAAEFWIRYPDPVYLAQVTERVNDAAKGAALATGTKVHIDIDSSSRNGISVSALNYLAFAYMKKFGATKVEDEPGRPLPFEETGTVATQIPGVGVTSHSSNGGYHTFEMEADALGDVGHHGFLVDAQTMTAVLYHFATDAPYRAAVKREFDGLKALYDDYLAALRNAYPLPNVVEQTGN
ncbi:MAG TPA: peptidase dimerization domain-containing protein [Gemmatimonadales bacterium]|nr:peptidase dimerization domain-containing protein [Gemmatimonadales bacterium]